MRHLLAGVIGKLHVQQNTYICCIMLPLLHRWEVRIRAEFRTENTTQKTLLRPVLNALTL